jgi:DNA-directed RNA polymerase specialized sigma24 family protein
MVAPPAGPGRELPAPLRQQVADPRDVLQEVFFNVYRYPHRFNSEREDAFRVWTAMIVRNTVLKHLRSQGRAVATRSPSRTSPSSPISRRGRSHRDDGVIDRGGDARVRARLPDLPAPLPAQFYSMLSPRERAAIHMVEVEESATATPRTGSGSSSRT